jgi:hypothetical protein
MGLDMYLHKKTYVKNWNHMSPEELHKITIKKGNKVRKDIKPERVSHIIEDVAYWRKFNALHNWFVQNCADGVDDCKEVFVSREDLEKVLDVLKEVKASLDKSPKKKVQVEVGWSGGEKMYDEIEVYEDTSVVEDLLPPTPGFFFGSTEVDEYFYREVCNTIETFEELLTEDGGQTACDYYYEASW